MSSRLTLRAWDPSRRSDTGQRVLDWSSRISLRRHGSAVCEAETVPTRWSGNLDSMAKLVFRMNQSLDGYVDHMAFAPSPTLFRHFIEEAQGQAGSVYGRQMYEVMRPAGLVFLRPLRSGWRRW